MNDFVPVIITVQGSKDFAPQNNLTPVSPYSTQTYTSGEGSGSGTGNIPTLSEVKVKKIDANFYSSVQRSIVPGPTFSIQILSHS